MRACPFIDVLTVFNHSFLKFGVIWEEYATKIFQSTFTAYYFISRFWKRLGEFEPTPL